MFCFTYRFQYFSMKDKKICFLCFAAMTTSKWDLLGEEESAKDNGEDLDGQYVVCYSSYTFDRFLGL